MREISKDEIKMLGEAERLIDGGHPYVMLDGYRLMATRECMDEFGLKTGQNINHLIHMEMLKWKIADCQAKLVEEELAKRGGTD